ncbi:HlyD family efflux transporter periplasmic adaptor subunit [Temperatibacter marinus]|uniref:HlyD family efflux transporter periplasmic adaptor subunit n=1 Tax=Temperatibacter marinus TaxID=1456591 RepID=A0AA52EG08_9PROT|nr:HlyD family efflux transporter periplasmic adaptor subunit [Temperatibacter marinus]WND01391.1 HlyD family efflux transporter periplasmic adaptor subunit [Temperatibacter marinus]
MFRKQVIDEQQIRYLGTPLTQLPNSGAYVVYFLVATVFVALAYVFQANYSRIIRVHGTIYPSTGVSNIVPIREGIISKVHIKLGDQVKAGDIIVTIATGEGGISTKRNNEAIERSLNLQAQLISEQESSLLESMKIENMELTFRKKRLEKNLYHLRQRLKLHETLMENVTTDFTRATKTFEAGNMSKRELESRQMTMLSERIVVDRIKQELDLKIFELAEFNKFIKRKQAENRGRVSSIKAIYEQSQQSIAQLKADQVYTLRAPINGNVSALHIKKGEFVARNQIISQLVKTQAQLEAQLTISPAAIGFVNKGQRVKLAIDAFPYEKFGTLDGTIRFVSTSIKNTHLQNGFAIPTFKADVEIDATSIFAYGTEYKLLPGMTVNAWIIAEKQTFYEWLLEPIFAIRKR